MKILSNLAVCLLAVLLFGFVIVSIDAADRVGPPEAYPSAPGLANPDVTQANINETICRDEYLKSIGKKRPAGEKTFSEKVRPASSYTNKLKLQQMKELGLTGKPGDFEEDHMESIEYGGHPTDPRNLSPDPYNLPYFGARVKDQVEDELHRQVCAQPTGTMTLKAAQSCISSDWIACGIRLKVKAVTDVWTKYEASLTKKK